MPLSSSHLIPLRVIHDPLNASLQGHSGKMITCKQMSGMLVWDEDKQMTNVRYQYNGTEKLGSMSQFERDAGCRLKNAKSSCKFVETGLSMGQAAAEVALQQGTAIQPQVDVTHDAVGELADYGCTGATPAEWLQGLGLDEYKEGFEKAGLTSIDMMLQEGLTQAKLTEAGVSKPGHITKLQFYLKKRVMSLQPKPEPVDSAPETANEKKRSAEEAALAELEAEDEDEEGENDEEDEDEDEGVPSEEAGADEDETEDEDCMVPKAVNG